MFLRSSYAACFKAEWFGLCHIILISPEIRIVSSEGEAQDITDKLGYQL